MLAFWALGPDAGQKATLNPNWLLDRYSAIHYREDNFLTSSIFLLAFCFLLVLDVVRYTFELTTNHLLNNQIKTVQNLMSDLGLLFGATAPPFHRRAGK